MGQTIGVAIIGRNVEATIKDCVESVIDHVDQVVVIKAGESTDKTPQILDEMVKAHKDKLETYDFTWIDDFSAARNFSFSKLKTDWYLWIDADDVVYQPENLRKLIDAATPDLGCIWFPYHYAIDEFGNLATSYIRERLLRATCGWIWRGRLHETVGPIRNCRYVINEDVIMRHSPSAGDVRKDRNFRILNLMNQEDPNDKRVWLYLGHQNFACGYHGKAAEWYLKFGQDIGAIPIERYQALCYCTKSMREMRDRQCIEVALMALELFPQYKDAYLELAHSYLVFGDYDKAIFFAQMSDVKEPMIQEPPGIIFINPLEYTFSKYGLLAECNLKKGQHQEALKYMKQCYAVRPTKDVENNVKLIEGLIRKEQVQNGIRALAVELINTGEYIRIPSLLAACPYWYRDTGEYHTMQQKTDEHTKDIEEKPEIVEVDKSNVVVNIGRSVNPQDVLKELDKKYEHIKIVSPFPTEGSKHFNVHTQEELENLLMGAPDRRLVNLRVQPTGLLCEYDHRVISPDSLSIRFYVGQGLEFWSPETIKENGCGGSETSAALLSKSLAEKGHQPFVYAMDNQTYDGVIYRHHSGFNPQSINCHLFISSRVPDVFDYNIPAIQKWLWAHDICFWERLTPDRAEKIDCIIALSHWHVEHIKRVYPYLKEAEVIDLDDAEPTYEDNWTGFKVQDDYPLTKVPKIAIIGDAIDTSRFKGFHEDRVPYRFIWCSSADRGLEELLNMWPLIKKTMPEATLKIFYGWEYFDTTLHMQAQREFKQRILNLIQQDRVQWCGRIGQVQLAHELKQADALLYPPHPFRETYGITFLEAQAAGVMCFYRQNGALGETIGDRGIPIPMDAKPEQIAELIASTLGAKTRCGKIREQAKKYGKGRDWLGQADKFLTLYRRLTYDTENRPTQGSSP